jgi:hypothetical protein
MASFCGKTGPRPNPVRLDACEADFSLRWDALEKSRLRGAGLPWWEFLAPEMYRHENKGRQKKV